MHKKTTHNIESWCQKVLDLLDLTFADLELHGSFGFSIISLVCAFRMGISPTLQLTFRKFPLFLQMGEEIGGQLMKLVDLWNIPDISRNPSQATQAKLTQRQRKFELFNPSQASGAAQ